MVQFLRLPAVMAITGLKKSAIYDSIDKGIFPKPTKITENGRANGWFSDEIARYVESRRAARDNTPTSDPAPKAKAVAAPTPKKRQRG
jgi:prophage regulatory protein